MCVCEVPVVTCPANASLMYPTKGMYCAALTWGAVVRMRVSSRLVALMKIGSVVSADKIASLTWCRYWELGVSWSQSYRLMKTLRSAMGWVGLRSFFFSSFLVFLDTTCAQVVFCCGVLFVERWAPGGLVATGIWLTTLSSILVIFATTSSTAFARGFRACRSV